MKFKVVQMIKYADLFCRFVMVILFAVTIISVFMRYGFSTGSAKLDDLQHLTFGGLVIFSLVIAFAANRHVKAELFTLKNGILNRKNLYRLWLLLLVCVPMGLILYVSAPEIVLSWQNLEGSDKPDGLGGLFLLKSLLPLFAIMMITLAIHKLIEKSDSSS